jgi:ABC-2 type transport system ATP-binding protein
LLRMSLPMIDVHALGKTFHASGGRSVEAVRGATFSVASGEIFGLLGPNGAGKTTLLRMLGTIITPTTGWCSVAGVRADQEPEEVRRRLGFLSGNTRLYKRLTGRELLRFFGRLYGVPRDRIEQRTQELATLLDMEGFLDRRCDSLSTGQTQKVSIARAILHDPPVLILDEPTVGLDPKQIIEIRELIKSLAGSHSVILSTHILPEATAVCQRVVIISGGRIVAEDTPEQLSARLRQSEKISVTMKAPPVDVETKLRTIPGVLNVFPGQSPGTMLIECALGQDLRDDLARFVVSNHWGLLELRTISMTLEDVFLRLTREEEGLSQAAGTPHADPAPASQETTQP